MWLFPANALVRPQDVSHLGFEEGTWRESRLVQPIVVRQTRFDCRRVSIDGSPRVSSSALDSLAAWYSAVKTYYRYGGTYSVLSGCCIPNDVLTPSHAMHIPPNPRPCTEYGVHLHYLIQSIVRSRGLITLRRAIPRPVAVRQRTNVARLTSNAPSQCAGFLSIATSPPLGLSASLSARRAGGARALETDEKGMVILESVCLYLKCLL